MKEDKKIIKILSKTYSIAVIGMKDDKNEVSYSVPEYLNSQGYEIFPVNPLRFGKTALGKEFFVKVYDIKEKIDLVEIFRRSEFLTEHAGEILQMNPLPKYVWFQSGIYDDNAAKMLEEKGIEVVQDKCMMVEYKRLRNKILKI